MCLFHGRHYNTTFYYHFINEIKCTASIVTKAGIERIRPTDNYEEDEALFIHQERLKLIDNPKAVLGAHNVYCRDEYKWTVGK